MQQQEKAINARLARDFVIALPHELSIEQNRWLLQNWIKENVTRKGLIADVSMHAPHEHGDDRNVHAHLMITTRKLGAQGQWAKTKERELDHVDTLEKWRASWEKLGNDMLKRHGFEPMLDRRTLIAQDIDREPQIHVGKVAAEMTRNGVLSERGVVLLEIDARNRQREKEKAQELHEERHAVRAIQELYGPTPASGPGYVSAIDRIREEEREQDRQQRHRDHARRGLLAALWNLTRTMGHTLSHIVLGADRVELMQGRRLADHDRERRKEMDDKPTLDNDQKRLHELASRAAQTTELAKAKTEPEHTKPEAAIDRVRRELRERHGKELRDLLKRHDHDKTLDGPELEGP